MEPLYPLDTQIERAVIVADESRESPVETEEGVVVAQCPQVVAGRGMARKRPDICGEPLWGPVLKLGW